MSGVGDIAGTLGAIAPQALAGYGRGRVRGMQYQQAEQQRQQAYLLRQLAGQLQQNQFDETKRHNAAVEAQNAHELAARGKEKEAAGVDEHRKFLVNLAYGPGSDERLYTLSQTPGALPAFYQMLQDAGVPLPGGHLLPAETHTVTTPQPDLLQTSQGPPLALPGSGVPGEGPFGIPPLQAPGTVTTSRTPQAPLTREEQLPARVSGTEFKKPAKFLAAEALADQRRAAAAARVYQNLITQATIGDQIRKIQAGATNAESVAEINRLRGIYEPLKEQIQQDLADSLITDRDDQQTHRATMERIAQQNANTARMGVGANKGTIADLREQLLRGQVEKMGQPHLNPADQALLQKSLGIVTQFYSDLLGDQQPRYSTEQVEGAKATARALFERGGGDLGALDSMIGAFGDAEAATPRGGPARGTVGTGAPVLPPAGTTPGLAGVTDKKLRSRAIFRASKILSEGPASVAAWRKRLTGDDLHVFEDALAEAQRQRKTKGKK